MLHALATYRINAKFAADELDYSDMVALAETLVGWAIDNRMSPLITAQC